MRSPPFAAISTIGLFIIITSLRHHARVLIDIARTYSTFYSLLETNPDLVYRYPTPIVGVATPPPRIIHQVALGNGSIEKYHDAVQSCRSLHSDWEFKLWVDVNATNFIEQNYPEILPHYSNYYQNIQRANILRYAVLHYFRGVYLDLDVTCLVALDSTPLMNLSFVSPGAHPAGVNNAFIVSQPGHAFLSHLLEAVPAHDLHWGVSVRLPYVENMLSSGCMFFSNIWMIYARALVAGRVEDTVHIVGDENGDLIPHMLRGVATTPLMAHGGTSSWHGWDAAAIVAIGRHYQLVVWLGGVACTGAIVSVVLRGMRARVRRRRKSEQKMGVLGDEIIYWRN